ncbi:MAG: hypothetical protein QM778_29830 [Myxococcales bacterium]
MLRSLWLLCLAGLMLAATSSTGHAQIHSGDLRLYLDSGFVTFTSDRRKGEDPDTKSHANTTNVSLLGSGGVGLAYVVNRYIVPGFYFSVQHRKTKTEIEGPNGNGVQNTGSATAWEVRPYLEIPFNADSRFVVHAIAGFSVLRPWQSFWTDSAIGVGPIVGIGGHGFITPHASLDATVFFRGAFIKDDDAEDAPDDPKFRQLSVLFMLGASYWL